MSLMLFAMGLGSRLSRFIEIRLLDAFILTEFVLSLLCSLSAELSYGLASFTSYTGLLIYAQAFIIGNLIGLEIPLVIRINEEYEELRINISGVMEKDYYGALAGGIFFAFFALPVLGLTYTPIALGSINFFVASILFWRYNPLIKRKKLISYAFSFTLLSLVFLGVSAEPVVKYGEQRKYKDKIIASIQTRLQKIVMTRWKNFYWLYINGQEQFSTFDEEKYHEPLVHPAIKIAHNISDILILGGGDGLALREVLKHKNVKRVTLVDLDPGMTDLAKKHPVLLSVNKGSMNNSKVRIINKDAGKFLDEDSSMYGVIIIDLPDPDSIDLMHVYSKIFYQNARRHLIRGGILVTQATSPYFSKDAFLCIIKTIRNAGFTAVPYHNQIPTMGEWGWVIGVKKEEIKEKLLKKLLTEIDFTDINTRFINKDAMISMIHFGKGIFEQDYMKKIKINKKLTPALYNYYLSGSWGMY